MILSWFMRFFNLFDHLFLPSKYVLFVFNYSFQKFLDDQFLIEKGGGHFSKITQIVWSNKLKNLINQKSIIFKFPYTHLAGGIPLSSELTVLDKKILS